MINVGVGEAVTNKKAIGKIYNSLADDGVLVLNVISSLEGKKSKFFQAQYKTLKEYFANIFIFPVKYYDEKDVNKHQNIIIFATKNKAITKKVLLEKADKEQQKLLEHLWEKEIIFDPEIKILTDNFAPVDFYISKLL